MFENCSILDLTKVIDGQLETYSSGDYRDPDYSARTWCSIEQQEYWVSQLSLGTQTGTHIDAPAHFVEGAATLERLPVENLIGSYFLIDFNGSLAAGDLENALAGYAREAILFLRCLPGARLSLFDLESLLDLPARVWVLAGGIEIDQRPALFLHRAVAERGVFLVENLDPKFTELVKPGGKIIALPLRLAGVSGSPCRVLVLQE